MTQLNEVTTSDVLSSFRSARESLIAQLIGHDHLIERLFIALLCRGHLLIEGAPGLAKTRAINRFSSLINTSFVRIQSTPDLLPADITGTDVYQQHNGDFSFLQGPLFNNIVLMDEVNRAPPKVQSALLEAMGEAQITIGGVTRTLAEPFMVAATQNPIEHEGTYPLPEAQLDRFMFFVNVELPDTFNERLILDTVLDELKATPADSAATLTTNDIENAQQAVSSMHLSDAVKDYIVRLVMATRGEGAGGSAASDIAQAASPRGSIFLAQASKAQAWLNQQTYVTPENVEHLASDVLSGRIGLSYQARAEGITSRNVIDNIVQATPKV